MILGVFFLFLGKDITEIQHAAFVATSTFHGFPRNGAETLACRTKKFSVFSIVQISLSVFWHHSNI